MYIEVRGIPVYYEDKGRGAVVVLLHGFLETSAMWSDTVKALSLRHRCIAIDLPGHGRTGCLGYVHPMELMAEVVWEVLRHLRVRKFALVGHSMGGYVALALAEQFPDHVKALVLVNSTPLADSEERKMMRRRAVEAVRHNARTFITLSIGNLFRPKNRKKFASEIKLLKKEAGKLPVQGITAALEGMKIRPDREVIMHFAPYPKLFMYGKKDPVIEAEEVALRLQNAGVRVVEFPDGHMSWMENKVHFIEELKEFLKNI